MGHYKGVRMWIVLSCLEEVVVAKGGTNFSPLKTTCGDLDSQKRDQQRRSSSGCLRPREILGSCCCQREEAYFIGDFWHFKETLHSTQNEWFEYDFPPYWKMPALTQNARAEEVHQPVVESSCLDPESEFPLFFHELPLEGWWMRSFIHRHMWKCWGLCGPEIGFGPVWTTHRKISHREVHLSQFGSDWCGGCNTILL